MKGKTGHRPGSDYKTHSQEGIADKTATKASAPKNRHNMGSTATSVGKFGQLKCKDGEGKGDKNSARR